MGVITLGIREAKANLSRYIRSVRQGQEIILTDHGRPVGKIVPLAQHELPLRQRLEQLEHQGIIAPGGALPADADMPAPPPQTVPAGLAQQILQQDRNRE